MSIYLPSIFEMLSSQSVLSLSGLSLNAVMLGCVLQFLGL